MPRRRISSRDPASPIFGTDPYTCRHINWIVTWIGCPSISWDPSILKTPPIKYFSIQNKFLWFFASGQLLLVKSCKIVCLVWHCLKTDNSPMGGNLYFVWKKEEKPDSFFLYLLRLHWNKTLLYITLFGKRKLHGSTR